MGWKLFISGISLLMACPFLFYEEIQDLFRYEKGIDAFSHQNDFATETRRLSNSEARSNATTHSNNTELEHPSPEPASVVSLSPTRSPAVTAAIAPTAITAAIGLTRTANQTAPVIRTSASKASPPTNAQKVKNERNPRKRDEDGCGLHPGKSSLHINSKRYIRWRPKYSNPNQDEFQWLKRTRECVQRSFEGTDMKFRKRDRPNRPEDFQTLKCNQVVDFQVTRDTLLNYETIWFLGDSILIQQFYTVLCMVNPDLNVTTDMNYSVSKTQDELISGKYVHHHTTANINTTDHKAKTTTFLFSRFGYKWNRHERNLYQPGMAFSTAIQNLTSSDAIVMDAAVHYDSNRKDYMERVLTHIRDQARQNTTRASVFYMEPPNEEWATSNGLFTEGCYMRCQCQKLTLEHILGNYDWEHLARKDSARAISREPNHRLKAPSLDFLNTYGLFVNGTNDNHQHRHHGNQSSGDSVHPHFNHTTNNCYPDCLPADWRRTLALSILGKKRDDTNIGKDVSIVPIFWQLALKPTPTFVLQGDCTHKSYEGIINMNQQLIRTMIRKQQQPLQAKG